MQFHNVDMRGVFKTQRVSSVPTYSATDKGRIFYDEDTCKFYFITAHGRHQVPWVDSSQYANLDAAVADLNSDGSYHLILVSSRMALTTDVSANIGFFVIPGGTIFVNDSLKNAGSIYSICNTNDYAVKIASGKTLTQTGYVQSSGKQKMFDITTGDIDFGSYVTDQFYPRWIGCDPTGNTSSSALLQKLIDAAPEGATINLSDGNWLITSRLFIDAKTIGFVCDSYGSGVLVKGNSYTGSMMVVQGCTMPSYYPWWGTTPKHTVGSYSVPPARTFYMNNVIFEGGDRSSVGHGLQFKGRNRNVIIDNIGFFNIKGYALCINDPDGATDDDLIGQNFSESNINNIFIRNCGYSSSGYECLMYGKNAVSDDPDSDVSFNNVTIVKPRYIAVRFLNKSTTASRINLPVFNNLLIDDTRHANLYRHEDMQGVKYQNIYDLIYIGDADGSVNKSSLGVAFNNLKIRGLDDDKDGVYVGYNCYVVVNGVTVTNGGDLATSNVFKFRESGNSIINNLHCSVPSQFNSLIYVYKMYTNCVLTLGPCAVNKSNLTKFVKIGSTANWYMINDTTTWRTHLNMYNIGTTASTQDTNVPFPGVSPVDNYYYKRIYMQYGGTLNVNTDGNYARFQIRIYNSAGSSKEIIYQDTDGVAGSTQVCDNMVIGKAYDFNDWPTSYIDGGESFFHSLTKYGTGESLADYGITIELSQYNYELL